MHMHGELVEKVVVVTGASSGIGRATALHFARAGAAVALAARSGEALREVRDEITRAGGRALAAECDVSDEDAVEALAERAERELGPLSVWVNDAAILAMGSFEETPPEVFRRLMETNFMGTVHGARAALRRFRTSGRGVLVNVASIDGKIAVPYASAYTASKHAVVGFSTSLRQELRLARARNVHVCVVLPATIDTPLFQHAANFRRLGIKALPPVYSPDRVARTIVRLATRPRRETFVGTSAHLMFFGWSLAPSLAERLYASMVDRRHFAHDHATSDTTGNAFSPTPPEAERGGWSRPKHWTRRALAVAAPAALAAGAVWASRRGA
jgi:NAD(P)-dependent dehydrogenase (short-subunit alcohol dehydrogenase family)